MAGAVFQQRMGPSSPESTTRRRRPAARRGSTDPIDFGLVCRPLLVEFATFTTSTCMDGPIRRMLTKTGLTVSILVPFGHVFIACQGGGHVSMAGVSSYKS